MIQNILKTDDKFAGFVVSDFGSVAVHSTGPSIAAGMDQELGPPCLTPVNAALDQGSISRVDIDAAATRVITVALETGSAVEMPWLNSVKGVVEVWYPGDQQGAAIARLLYGNDNFTGIAAQIAVAGMRSRRPAV